jgi:DNA-binding NtrC family response regulator
VLDSGDILVGDSDWAREMRAEIVQVARYGSNVLISGASGTGKELIAQAIHRHSPRAARPFVLVDCAAVSSPLFAGHLFGHVKGAFTGASHDTVGCFRAADGGTVFLDEVGELELSLQSQLLRVLEQRTVTPVGSHREVPVDVRVIAATNRDLGRAVAAGRFREDLYHRLNVLSLRTLPLKDHPEDIEALARHLFARFAEREHLDVLEPAPHCLEHMCSLDWPGNVREFANFVERLVVLGQDKAIERQGPCPRSAFIGEADVRLSEPALPAEASPASSLPSNQVPAVAAIAPGPPADWPTLEDVERDHLQKTLIHTHYNLSAAAKLLKIGRQQLARKIKHYGLDPGPRLRGRPRGEAEV